MVNVLANGRGFDAPATVLNNRQPDTELSVLMAMRAIDRSAHYFGLLKMCSRFRRTCFLGIMRWMQYMPSLRSSLALSMQKA